MHRCLVQFTRLASPPNYLPRCAYTTTSAATQQGGKALYQSDYVPTASPHSQEPQALEKGGSDDGRSDAVNDAPYVSGDEALDFLLAGYEAQSANKTSALRPVPRTIQTDGDRRSIPGLVARSNGRRSQAPQAETRPSTPSPTLVCAGRTRRPDGPEHSPAASCGIEPPSRLLPRSQRTADRASNSREDSVKPPASSGVARARRTYRPSGGWTKHLLLPGKGTCARRARLSPLKLKHFRRRRRKEMEMAARKRLLRPFLKPLRLTPRPDEFADLRLVWRINFAKIQRIYDKRETDTYLQEAEPPELDERVKDLVEKVDGQLNSGDGSLSVNALVGELGIDRWTLWLQVTLWLLYHRPDKVVRFLVATHRDPYPPSRWVANSLHHLAQHYTHVLDPSTGQRFHELCDAFCTLAQHNSAEQLRFRGNFFRFLIPHCSDQQIQQLYTAIKLNGVAVTDNTFLHFANYFAKNNHFQQGLDALLEAHRAGADLRGFPFRSNCATMLRKAMEQPGGMRTCLDIVENLVKIGLVLNTQLCNIIMLNAVDTGDLETAWSVFHSLRQNGLEADAYTYAVLLKGCKDHNDDAELLNNTIRAAIDGMNVLQEPVVATEILHCLVLHHLRHHPDDAWATVCEAYAQMFDLKPLQQLGFPLPKFLDTPPPTKSPMSPPPHTISIMIRLYVQIVRNGLASQTQIYETYKRYRAALAAGEEPFASLAKTDYIPNAFLMGFVKHKRTLLHAAEVIRDMQNPDANVHQTPPTVQTWSIFLLGFVEHNQMKLAEQVVTYMRSKGMEPNKVTRNTLVKGYACEQDVEGTTEALERLRQGGHAWDSWTYSGLKRLRNSQRLGELLEKKRRTVALDFTGELKKGIEERIANVEREVGDRCEGVGVTAEADEVAGDGNDPSWAAELGLRASQ